MDLFAIKMLDESIALLVGFITTQTCCRQAAAAKLTCIPGKEKSKLSFLIYLNIIFILYTPLKIYSALPNSLFEIEFIGEVRSTEE